MIITIDGPAGSGKSTISKLLADKLSYYQIDSGALYRTITYFALEISKKQNINLETLVESLVFQDELSNLDVQIYFEHYKQIILLNGINVEEFIRTPIITQNIKSIADNVQIRLYVNEKIRDFAKNHNIIADGRDMGTVVFPNADFKFFFTASLLERAKRRYNEFVQKNSNISLEEIMKEIELRDNQDSTRTFGRLEQVKDTILVDTDNKNIDTVLLEIFTYITKNIK